MEENGAVFLPSTSKLTAQQTLSSQTIDLFRYWTSTNYDATKSYQINLSSTDADSGNTNTYGLYTTYGSGSQQGLAVRLARTVNYTKKVQPNYIEGSYSGTGITVFDITWAPVNCGYDATDYPYGKAYQGGRFHGLGHPKIDTGTSLKSSASNYPGNNNTNPNGTEDASTFYATSNVWYQLSSSTLYTKNMYRTWWNAGTEDDPVKGQFDPCPDGWRVPTKNELTILYNHTGGTATSYTDGRKGYKFKDSGNNTIFLPFMGYVNSTTVTSSDSEGFYISSNGYFTSDSPKQFLYFWHYRFGGYSSTEGLARFGTSYGGSIRCVKDTAVYQ